MISITWIRGGSDPDYRSCAVFFVLGQRGTGKSSFLEAVAARYLEEGGKVLDLFGARDGEGLAWLRSPYARSRKILLLRGDLVEVRSGQPSLPASRFALPDLERADIFVSAAPLYESMDAEFRAVNHLLDVLWSRRRWTYPVFLLVREAANLVYSRMKIGESQQVAKAELLYLMREARHAGLALGLDTQRHTAVDVDLRAQVDYLIIKNIGSCTLPDDLNWAYKVFNPPALRTLRPHEFLVLHRGGGVGMGVFELPPWHKLEHEDILGEVGLELRYLLPKQQGPQAKELVAEALKALPPGTPAFKVAEWIKEKKGVQIAPEAVGHYARELGYCSIKKEGAHRLWPISTQPANGIPPPPVARGINKRDNPPPEAHPSGSEGGN